MAEASNSTFVPYANGLNDGWTSEYTAGPARSRSREPVELTVFGGLPDIMQFVVGTFSVGPSERF